MAVFNFNGGNVSTIQIDKKYLQTKIYISGVISFNDSTMKIAGHSVISLDGNLSFEDVQFKDHPLDYLFKIINKKLAFTIDVSKFNPSQVTPAGAYPTIKCTLTLEAGDNLINTYSLDDSANSEANSIFNYLFTFTSL